MNKKELIRKAKMKGIEVISITRKNWWDRLWWFGFSNYDIHFKYKDELFQTSLVHSNNISKYYSMAFLRLESLIRDMNYDPEDFMIKEGELEE